MHTYVRYTIKKTIQKWKKITLAKEKKSIVDVNKKQREGHFLVLNYCTRKENNAVQNLYEPNKHSFIFTNKN